MPTDAELLLRQDALQADARAILADLDLLDPLAAIGRPVLTGSAALGLMVARDIDVTTLCPTLDVAPLFAIGSALATHPRVRALAIRNDTGRWNTDAAYPDGLYWRVDYATDAGVDWNLDLWFLAEGTSQFDLEHVRSLPPRLTTETRAAILSIKTALRDRAAGRRIPSYEVYAAVLDHGVRTPLEFERQRAARPTR